ncbi:V0D/AC39 family V-type ATPase subunit [Rhabdochromatium marinum]|uniref:V0D/AC39 family V-type ATPase subunit n=1 Tax=Rhabdochromatium marinum TaxID=48729 RepID=UPI001906D033|nr:V-type ATPase subunit [Rhabdochromatium marinum]MBK1647930.1 ATPase [Rhabdochromatium marinum]
MSAAAHAYLNTRVSVMSARLLDAQRANALLELPLQELVERLDLAAIIEEELSTHAKMRAVEQALIQTLLADVSILIRPMNPAERALVLSWGRRYALFNLKTLIRGKLYDLDSAAIRKDLYDLPPGLRLSRDELFRTENVLELLRVLERGPFSLLARQAREVYEQKREPFALEAAIDQQYYSDLVRQTLRFQGDSLQPLRRLIGALLDRVDLMWMLRFRFAYGFSPSETFYQLVPSPRLLHRARLLDLVNRENLRQLLSALPDPLAEQLAEATDLIEVQRLTVAHQATETRRILSQSASGVTRALAYLILREMDLMFLLALIQGGLLGLPQDVIKTAVDPHTLDSSGMSRSALAAAA